MENFPPDIFSLLFILPSCLDHHHLYPSTVTTAYFFFFFFFFSPKFDVTQDFLFHLKPRQPAAFHCIAPSSKEHSSTDKSSGEIIIKSKYEWMACFCDIYLHILKAVALLAK